MKEMNSTIDYYNNNANQYFSNTVNVDMSESCDKFLKYVILCGRIIDIGAGSGRDIDKRSMMEYGQTHLYFISHFLK